MVLTAHQPVYLPWLGLFHKIWLAEKFVLFNTVQYLPKEWMNRNKIKTNEGEIWLTVPVLKKGFLTGTYFYSSICHMPRLINKYRNAIDETFYKLMNLKK